MTMTLTELINRAVIAIYRIIMNDYESILCILQFIKSPAINSMLVDFKLEHFHFQFTFILR